MKDISYDELKTISIEKLVDQVLNDQILSDKSKYVTLKECRTSMYYKLKYHKLTKSMVKEMHDGIKYITKVLNELKINK